MMKQIAILRAASLAELKNLDVSEETLHANRLVRTSVNKLIRQSLTSSPASSPTLSETGNNKNDISKSRTSSVFELKPMQLPLLENQPMRPPTPVPIVNKRSLFSWFRLYFQKKYLKY